MEQIFNGNKQVLSLLGVPKSQEETIKTSMFVLKCKVQNGWLFFSTLTRKLILLSDSEYEKVGNEKDEITRYLFENWFLVNNSLDEQKLYDELYCVFKPERERKFNGFSIYIIFTTTYCNANCFYCFERNTKQINMTEKTEYEVVEYILRTYNMDEKVTLHWFGGEPMCNYKVIDIVCQELSNKGISFSSRFTSNASIFNKELIIKAVEKWKTNNIQVTLDGTENEHNRRKAYNDQKYNFKQTIDNIKDMEKAGINVTIRLNCDEDNIDDMERLVEQLIDIFKGRKKIFIDPHPIFNCDKNEKIKITTEAFYSRMILLENITHTYNISNNEEAIKQSGNGLERIRTGTCQSVSMRISPDGKLYPCQHIDQVASYGNINEGITDKKEFECWRLEKHSKKCMQCKFRPLCASMERCNAVKNNCYCYAERKYLNWIKDIYKDYYNYDKVMKIEKKYVVHSLLGEHVVVFSKNTDMNTDVVRLNDSAYFMFNEFVIGCSVKELSDKICKEFAIKKEIADLLVRQFRNKLIESGLVN